MRKPSGLWLLLILVGFLVRENTTILHPVHEHLHAEMVALTGGRVTSQTWSHITWRGGNHDLIRYFGYGGEVLLYGAWALLMKRSGMFAAGVMVAAGYDAFRSDDFARLPPIALAIHAAIWFAMMAAVWGRAWYWYEDKKPKTEKASHNREVVRRLRA